MRSESGSSCSIFRQSSALAMLGFLAPRPSRVGDLLLLYRELLLEKNKLAAVNFGFIYSTRSWLTPYLAAKRPFRVSRYSVPPLAHEHPARRYAQGEQAHYATVGAAARVPRRTVSPGCPRAQL